MAILTAKDYLLLPFYLLLIFFAAIKIRNRLYPAGHPWRPYFIKGLIVKIGGALALCFLYRYYYGTGDIMKYFHTASVINSSFGDSPVKWYNLLTVKASLADPAYKLYFDVIDWYGVRCFNMYLVSIVAAIIGIFTFNTYLNTSIVFAALCYTGLWALFRTFAKLYPQLIRYVAVSVLFIPSVVIWSSGISKDTICLFSIGWIVHFVYKWVLYRHFRSSEVLLFLISSWALFYIKPYIFFALFPALFYWVCVTVTAAIPKRRRASVRLITLLVLTALFMAVPRLYPRSFGKYSVYSFARTSEATREIIYKASVQDPTSSYYDLGAITSSPYGLSLKALPAINATLYRPYIWESKKPIVLGYAVESTLLLIATLYVFFRRKLSDIARTVFYDYNVQFFLIFTFIFAFALGISTYNFGSLSRYRIPCLPFFMLSLAILYKQPAAKPGQSVSD